MISTEEMTNVKKGRIILQCELGPGYYTYATGEKELDLSRISEDLFDIEYELAGLCTKVQLLLSTVVPVGVEMLAAKTPRWLSVEVSEAGGNDNFEFEEFIMVATARIIERLTGMSHKASVEIGDTIYVITTEGEGDH